MKAKLIFLLILNLLLFNKTFSDEKFDNVLAIGLFEYLDANAGDALASIVSEGKISDETAEALDKAIVDYKAGFNA